MVYVVDIDGILCDAPPTHSVEAFRSRVPNKENIALVNALYNAGHKIILFTSRRSSDKGVVKVTKEWLASWGVKYHELKFDKPQADLYVDDHATCNFPQRRGLFIHERKSSEEMWIFAYLHNERLQDSKLVLKLPDRYVVRISKHGLEVSAQGEFLRDKDLKEEAITYIKIIIDTLAKAGAFERPKTFVLPMVEMKGKSEH